MGRSTASRGATQKASQGRPHGLLSGSTAMTKPHMQACLTEHKCTGGLLDLCAPTQPSCASSPFFSPPIRSAHLPSVYQASHPGSFLIGGGFRSITVTVYFLACSRCTLSFLPFLPSTHTAQLHFTLHSTYIDAGLTLASCPRIRHIHIPLTTHSVTHITPIRCQGYRS